jgi:Brp/Blh family beta-carotene 15,15'-monooxygenase
LYFYTLMNLFTFIYLVGIYLLLNLFQGFENIGIENQLIYSSLFILLIGIPHGAIDHILLFKKREMSQIKFYLIYLGLIIGFIMMWHFSPLYSLLFFLLISAFHFGESQFADIKFYPILKNLFYFFWGLSLLSTLIFYNIDELNNITLYFDDTLALEKIYNTDKVRILFYLTNTITILAIFAMTIFKKIKTERLLSEIFLLFLIHITFYLFPFIIGFTLYFVALHSLKVMNDEFMFFKKENPKFSILDFLKMLAPYSILSIFFTAILLSLSYLNHIPYSIPFLSIMIISVITLPHAIVMNIFYNE